MKRRRDVLRGLLGSALALPAAGSVVALEAAAERPVPTPPEPPAAAPGRGHLSFPSAQHVRAARLGGADGRVRSLGTAGFHEAGDGGAALYRRASTEPLHPGKIRSADGAWWEIAEPVVESKMLGAVCDGTTDDTAAIAALSDYLGAHPGAHVRLSPGTSLCRGGFGFTGGGTLSGHGRDTSRLKMATGGSALLYRGPGLPPISDVTLRDFALEGDWGGLDHADGTYQTDGGAILVELWDIDHLTVEGVRFEYGRSMAFAARNCDVVSVRGCAVRYCARDGINCARSHRVLVNDNTIDHVDDDAIAVHMENSEPEPAHKEAVISGNRVSDSQGIKIIGLQRAAVTGNQIERCRFAGIMMVVPKGFPVGRNAAFAVNITGNVVTDVIDRRGIDGLNATATYVRIAGAAPQAADLPAPPGRPVPGGGAVVPLHENLPNAGPARPLAESFGMVVANNVCMRTLPTAKAYTEYGYGRMFLRSGWADPEMTEGELQGDAHSGVVVSDVRDVVVEGNVCSGTARGAVLKSATGLRNIAIRDNIFRDFTLGGVSGADAAAESVLIEDNLFDGDPLHRSRARRGRDGSWRNTPIGAALRLPGGGFAAIGNHFRNVPKVAVPVAGPHLYRDNLIHCEPAALGYDPANKGVGDVVRSGGDFLYVIEHSDPASAAYGEIRNHCPVAAPAVPSSGIYVTGHRVENQRPEVQGPAGSRYVVTGWIRLTTGSGHRVGVDWLAMRAPTGT